MAKKSKLKARIAVLERQLAEAAAVEASLRGQLVAVALAHSPEADAILADMATADLSQMDRVPFTTNVDYSKAQRLAEEAPPFEVK
jgi:hypothetical protein